MDALYDRRQLLAGGLALPVAAKLGGDSKPPAATPSDSRLVVIELIGGLDGLSTIVPFHEDDYYRARPHTSLAPQDVLRIHPERGLHPALAPLRKWWDKGQMAIVEGCGYPGGHLSHFRSFEVWRAADLRGRGAGDGWLGRLREAAWPDQASFERMVHVGSPAPFSMHNSRFPCLAFESARSLTWTETRSLSTAEASAPSENPLDRVRQAMQRAHSVTTRIQDAVKAHRPKVSYPDLDLGHALHTLSAILHSGLPTRVFSAGMGNFDCHGSSMRREYEALHAEWAECLNAFLEDLESSEAGRHTTVLVLSEFGRRVAENRSQGTDHGTAVPMLLFGPRVQGGLYGEHPSLTELDANGNFVPTTDFRRVYASLLEQAFGVEAGEVISGSFEPLPLLSKPG